jgi:hypothetical protein
MERRESRQSPLSRERLTIGMESIGERVAGGRVRAAPLYGQDEDNLEAGAI